MARFGLKSRVTPATERQSISGSFDMVLLDGQRRVTERGLGNPLPTRGLVLTAAYHARAGTPPQGDIDAHDAATHKARPPRTHYLNMRRPTHWAYGGTLLHRHIPMVACLEPARMPSGHTLDGAIWYVERRSQPAGNGC